MSQPNQTQQLYPVLGNQQQFQQFQNGNDKKSQPIYVQPVVLVQPNNQNQIQHHDMKQPLLSNETYAYPVYHPKGMVGYARKSRNNCCRVFCGIACCCCLFLFAIVGLAVGLVAWKCMQMDYSTTQVLTVDPTGATLFQINAQHGDISITQSTDTTITNVTITITRRASDDDLFGTFTTALTNEDGEVTFNDMSSSNNWWNVVGQICMQVQIEVTLPYSFQFTEFTISTDNGDISISALSANNFQISTTNGNIDVYGIQSNDISLRTTNGDVSADNCTANTMSMSTTNGDIKIGSISIGSSFSGTSTNGNVHIDQNLVCSGNYSMSIDFATSNGDLELSFMECNTNFHFATTNGDVSVDPSGANVQYSVENNHESDGNFGPSSKGNMRGTSTNGDITAVFYFN